jgi:adenine-specific DNA methylase
MVWDYAESNPFADSSGGFLFGLDWLATFLEVTDLGNSPALVTQQDAAALASSTHAAVITDPPYYNAIDYAGLSDFFYVWLKRSLEDIHPGLLSLPLTPKREQAIMASEKDDAEARGFYVDKMRDAFSGMSRSLKPDGLIGVVFAHTDPDAWSTLIDSLIATRVAPVASWPIDTELSNKTGAANRANLSTSVWMACRFEPVATAPIFLDEVLAEMRPVIRDRLLYFWSKGIRGADFFISAIGPALSVFGRHTKVMYPDGKDVSVRDFLDLVRRESTEVALEQVLGGAILGQLDSLTRQYVTWIWSYSRAPLDAGEAIALCLATGADYSEVVRDGSIAAEAKEKSKKMVKLRTIKERGAKEDELGVSNGARPVPLIDQLQRAAHLWFLNRPEQLVAYRESLGETRWTALRTLGQAVAECLPEGDDDRRLINGLLGSNVMATTLREDPRGAAWREQPGKIKLPGFEGSDARE